MRASLATSLFLAAAALAGCAPAPYDVVIRHGTIYDGSGGKPYTGDVAVKDGKIAVAGALPEGATAKVTIDASGKAVAPGFINMLSHCEESLLQDGRSQSDIRQGVTLEVLGESSMGPLSEAMKQELREGQTDFHYDIRWNTLGEYLDVLGKRGISPNVASFVGAGTVRQYVLGYDRRDPTPAEMDRMRGLVEQAMEEGALGLTTALLYPPDTFATTDQLVELAKVAARHGGLYSVHMRNEGDHILDAIDETVRIAREAKIRAEIYHLKISGKDAWDKMPDVIAAVERARGEGLHITADMYLYTAGATNLAATIPSWALDGGLEKLKERIHDPATREKIKAEMNAPGGARQNLYREATPSGIRFLSFKTEGLRPYIGKTLAEVAAARGKSPEDTVMDLLVEDGIPPSCLYFIISEDNIRREVALPWMSFGSDAESSAAEGTFLAQSTHPRAYGNFARLLGHYVREEKLVTLQEAIARLTSFPATVLELPGRGRLDPGYAADVVVFDPKTIEGRSTYEKPFEYATGVTDVLVNGVPVLRDGQHTGEKPGRIVRGPGYKPPPPKP